MWILDQEMQITVVMILMLYNETFEPNEDSKKNNQSKKSLRKGKKATKTENRATGKIGKNTKN